MDEDAMDEDATDEDATDEDATDEVWSGLVQSEEFILSPANISEMFGRG